MSEIDRRLAGALADLAEHYERAMTRQAEQNEQLQVKTLRSHVEQLAELEGRLQRQVNDLALGLRRARRHVARAVEAIREQIRQVRWRGPEPRGRHEPLEFSSLPPVGGSWALSGPFSPS